MTDEDMHKIEHHIDDIISKTQADTISCDWSDRQNGYVVTVTWGNHRVNATGQSRVQAYANAVQVAAVDHASRVGG